MTMPAAPSSRSPERDARHLSGGDRVEPGEIAVGVIIGRTSEFFDFFVYAIASVLVFPQYVFPFAKPLEGTLLSFAMFAIAFVTRPIGTALFTWIDIAYGRGSKLTIALFTLGCSTVALGFLPSYDDVGWWSIALLALLRAGQGLALGGAYDGLAALLALGAPEGRRGWYAMIPQLGAPLGLIVASTLFLYFYLVLTPADFMGWGWRYPFFVAFAINVVALFARLRIVVSASYSRQFDAMALEPTPVVDTLRAEGRTIFAGAFAPLASFALFHTVTVFPLSWVILETQQTATGFLIIEIVGAVVGVGAIVVSGLLADHIGRRRLLTILAGAIAAFSGFAPALLNAGYLGESVFMIVGFTLLGLSFGQSAGALASNFQLKYRYTGAAITSDLAWLFGAGFAPWVALTLASRFGLMAAGGYLLSGALCTIAALAIVKPASADR
ncbi:MAG TPA: MFS transporter [Steroidobacteraceae bacterium]|nr:MFS transporter [Steroidobacteraceae bacterium]